MPRRLARDPVARFLVLGALIFLVDAGLRSGAGGSGDIVVTPAFVRELTRQHQARFGRAPSPGERERLVGDYVEEECLVREAEALGLDRGDPIVRRRLAQKMKMMLRSRLQVARPTDDELRAYIAAHPDSFARDERFGFRHAFASRDLREAPAAAAAAWVESARAAQVPGDALAGVGDAFALGPRVEDRTGAEIERQFGSAFRTGLASCAVGLPCGPLESTYGFHAVVLTSRAPAGGVPFAQARPLAERELLRDREEAALGREVRALVERYEVQLPPGSP